MSAKATGYASDTKFGSLPRRCVFSVMADSANHKTGVMWHSIDSIAESAEVSRRTVQRQLDDLVELGYIREGDQAYVAHLPARNRPVVYEVATCDADRDAWAEAYRVDPATAAPLRAAAKVAGKRRGPEVSESHLAEVSESHVGSMVRGDTGAQSEVSLGAIRGDSTVSPKQEENRKEQEPSSTAARPTPVSKLRNDQLDARFDEFWDAYGKKVGRGQAVKAWRAALRTGVDVDLVITAAGQAREYYAAEIAAGRTAPQYVPHPTTWLNGQRWADERVAREARRATAAAVATPAAGLVERAPDGLDDAQYAEWERAQLARRRA